jgi:hypothetical protein
VQGYNRQLQAGGRLQMVVDAWCIHRLLLSNMQAGVEKSITSLAM